MDWKSTMGHEVLILCWNSIYELIALTVGSILGLENILLWPTFIIIIFKSIIQDSDAFPEPPSIFIQLVRFFTNAFAALLAIVTSGFICHYQEDDAEPDISSPGKVDDETAVAMECGYGYFGLVIIAYLTSFFLLAAIRSIMAGAVLVFKIFHSVWMHFNDPMD